MSKKLEDLQGLNIL